MGRKGIKKTDLTAEVGGSSRTIAKIARGERLSNRTLQKIAGRDGRAHVDFPTRGFWDIEAVAVYPDGARIATTASVAVVGRPIPHDMIRKSRYGVMTVHGRNELGVLGEQLELFNRRNIVGELKGAELTQDHVMYTIAGGGN